MYYGKVARATTGYILSLSYFTINAVQDLMDVVPLKDTNVLITLEEMHALKREAYSVYVQEVKLPECAMKTKDFDEHEQFEVERHLQEFVHFYTDRIIEGARELLKIKNSI